MRITDILERPQSRELLAKWYAAALEDQATSGLSVAEYASEIGVSPATLYQWRRRLCSQPDTAETASSPPDLIEVVPDDRGVLDPEARFVVRLRDDRSVEVPPQFDHAELARLISTLESC